jgi:aromatic ring hydroxylase
MGPDDADYAVSFATPVDTPGLSLFVSAYGARDHDAFEFPISSKHKMLETLTVFDDVFVPWERVFVCRQPELAGAVSSAFVEFHRYTAVSYKLPLLDALVGTAALIAEMNGVAKAGHIREKLTQLIIYAETVRALTEMAGIRAQFGADGIAYPDPLTTNMAKYTFATKYHGALELVQDCAGGLLVTGPGGADWANPEVRAVMEKFYASKAPAEERLRLLNTISDLTARDFGGYHAVLAVHAEGSIEAEKMQIYRAYEPGRAVAYARRLAGLDETA